MRIKKYEKNIYKSVRKINSKIFWKINEPVK